MVLSASELAILSSSIQGVLERHPDPLEQRRELMSLGIYSILFPEHAGGAGLGPDELLLLAKEAGRVASSGPLMGPEVLSGVILTGISPATAVNGLLQDIANGQAIPTLASDDLIPVHVRSENGHSMVSGAKKLVPDAHVANVFLVSADIDGDPVLFRIDRGTEGLEVRPYSDGADGDLMLTDIRVSANMELVRGPLVRDLIGRACAMAKLAVCARMVGSMERLLELTLDYLRTRKQFGQTLSSFQVLQHAAVDMYVEIETARPMIEYGAAMLTAPDAEREAALNAIKLKINEAAKTVGENAVQLHGGIGMTMESLVGRLVADLTKKRASYGGRRECLHSLVTHDASPALV